MPTNDVPAATRQVDAPPLTPATPDKNSSDLLLERVAKTPDAVLFALPDGDGWKDVTAREFLDRVRALAKGFVAAGIEPGDKIGMMAPVGYDWSLVDFAAWFAGAVLVPVYDTSSAFQMRWNLSDSGATALIMGREDAVAKFESVRDELPLVTNVWQVSAGDLDALTHFRHAVEALEDCAFLLTTVTSQPSGGSHATRTGEMPVMKDEDRA